MNSATQLSTGAKNVVRLLCAGINPELRGMSGASLREAHMAGLITWNRDYTGQGWSVAPQGRDLIASLDA